MMGSHGHSQSMNIGCNLFRSSNQRRGEYSGGVDSQAYDRKREKQVNLASYQEDS